MRGRLKALRVFYPPQPPLRPAPPADRSSVIWQARNERRITEARRAACAPTDSLECSYMCFFFFCGGMDRIDQVLLCFYIGLVSWIWHLKKKQQTIITFMRVKCGIMALAAVVPSLIEGILAVR